MGKYLSCDPLDVLADKYGLSREERILIQKFINLGAEKRTDIADCIIDMAAAIQEDCNPATVISPETTSKEEKIAALDEFLTALARGRNIIPIKFPLVEPTWRRWM